MNTNSAKQSFESYRGFDNFARHVKHEQRYIFNAQCKYFLDTVRATSGSRSSIIKAGVVFWWAQRGHGWRFIEEIDDEVPCAYPPKRMKPLPPFIAPAGRINPKGISCLYLSSTEETAVAEVRSGLGEYVSVGTFKISRDIKIIDCSVYHDKGHPFYFTEPDDEKKEKAVWTDIDKAFSKPVMQGDDNAEYIPTQIIAELFKAEGYDGIGYKSAFTENGFNLALFHLKDADLKRCGLYDVKRVKFEYAECDNPYYVSESTSESA